MKKKTLRASNHRRSRRPTGSTALKRTGNADAAKRNERRRVVEAHLGMPWAEWQTKKRQEWRAVMSALCQFEWGSAYTPAGGDLYAIHRAANRIKDAMAKDWVSW